jgi:hypothetical protein
MVVMLNVVWLFCDLKEVGFVQDVDDDWRRWRWCCVFLLSVNNAFSLHA